MESIHPVILGGGIIGLSTAYYLLTHPSLPSGSSVTLIERTAIAHGASGRAMGMIGREWQPRHTLPLSRLSWRCYEELRETLHPDEWGWTVKPAMGVEVAPGAPLSKYRSLPVRGAEGSGMWRGEAYDMKDDGAVAFVNPAKFCQALLRKSIALGLRLIIANPNSLDPSKRRLIVHAAETPDEGPRDLEIQYTHLQISAGPWSAPLCRKLGLLVPEISNLPGHSIHIRPCEVWEEEMVGRSVFAGVSEETTAEDAVDESAWEGGAEERGDGGGVTGSIELMYREDGTVYVAGENGAPSSSATAKRQLHGLPDDPGDVAGLVSPRLVQKLIRAAAILSPTLDVRRGAEIVHSQVGYYVFSHPCPRVARGYTKRELCYRPTSPDGTPQLGFLDEDRGILLAAGHGPWVRCNACRAKEQGITLGPGSGHLMADIILGQDPGFSIAAFRLSRFKLR